MFYSEQFIDKYATERGITKEQSKREVKAFLKVLEESILYEGGVSFRNLLTLETHYRRGRVSVLNGESFVAKGKRIVRAKVGKSLSEKLNNK